MKRAELLLNLFLMLAVILTSYGNAVAAQNGLYFLEPAAYTWDGTIANRQLDKTLDYSITYGDEASVTYSLPWGLKLYGQTFDKITADTNGNIWFGSVTGSAHSFNLANNGRGPVIAAWNNDLSSYYYGGVFIQRKYNPERVVVEWQTETYTNEGLMKPNNFEVVLYPNGDIRLDYKTFSTATTNKDFGSGVSFNDGTNFTNLTNSLGGAYGLAEKSYTLIYSYPITTSPGTNGTIQPNTPFVHHDANQTFNIVPNTGYHVKDIYVDGVSLGVVENLQSSATMTYTFQNVNAPHIISATFAINKYPITINQGIGDISPSSTWVPHGVDQVYSILVQHGNSQTFTISHTSRYLAVAVNVDGVSQGTPSSYTFTNVTGPHTIEAAFSLIPCSNPPVRILGTESYFTSPQAAYDAALNGATIQVQGQLFTENFTAGAVKNVNINGGYTCEYVYADYSMLQGAQSVTGGAVNIKDVRILK